MPIKRVPVEFELTDFPQYVELEGERYEIDRVNRLRDNGSSALLIIYKGKHA